MKFVSWVAGSSLELTRWDEYWGGRVPVKDLTIRIIPDSATRLLTLETGGIDIMYNVPTSDISRVEAHRDLNMIRSMNLSTNFIGFNMQKAPFNDIRVRHAIAHAIDMPLMVRNVYRGAGSPTNGPINTMVWSSIADQLQPYEFNQARSRQLLAEAGYPNGFNTTFSLNEGNPERLDTGEILANMLRQVGINVDIRVIEWGSYLEMTGRGDHDMFILGWSPSGGDPDRGLYATFHSSNFGAPGNRAFYNNPEVDRLLDAGRRELDRPRRAQLYAQAQRIIRDELPWIFQWAGEELSATRADVKGFSHHAATTHALWNLYRD
jgi:peptide/nickel transport system substrate-binding protein